jgi:membrane protease YdiL (CAAX protease family)
MMRLRRWIMLLVVVTFVAALFLASSFAARMIHFSPGSFFPPSFVTHSLMLALSAAAILALSKGRLAAFGFTKGSYSLSPRILWWLLPVAVLSIAGAIGVRGGRGADSLLGLTKIQTIVFVWIWASLCEETLVRGLLQSMLTRIASGGSSTRVWTSMPVLVSGLFFSAMHLVLIKRLGPAAIPMVAMATYLGLVAARYREKTGSLFPAFLLHAFFNIVGVFPLWVAQWMRAGL